MAASALVSTHAPLSGHHRVMASNAHLARALERQGSTLQIGRLGIRVFEVPEYGFNELVHGSDTIVVGTVSTIGEHRWNSTSGEKYDADPDRDVFYPAEYRLIAIEIDEVVSSADIRSKTLSFVAWHSSEAAGGDIFLGLSTGPVLYGRLDGEFEVGERRLLFLRKESIPLYGGGELSSYSLTNSY